jgi:Fanconi anemia group M protein
MLTIDVDGREYPKGVAELLTRMPGVQVQRMELEAGDYRIGRWIGIERKTMFNFIQSIRSAHLFEQMGALRKRYARALLIVEHLSPGRSVAGMSWSSIRGAMVSVSASYGIPVLPSSGPVETAELVRTAGAQAARPVPYGYPRVGRRPTGWKRQSMYILESLPGVGPARAAALLEALGSVTGVVTATADQLQAVRGVGTRVAAAIRRAVEPACPPPVQS